MNPAAASIVSIDIESGPLRQSWRLRCVLAAIVILIGGVSILANDMIGWLLVAFSGALAVHSVAKLSGLKNAPRIELLADRIHVWGLLIGAPRRILYSDVRLVDWQVQERSGYIRIVEAKRFPFSINSVQLGSLDAIRALIRELEDRLPAGRVVDRARAQPHRMYATLGLIAALVAIHGAGALSGRPVTIESIIENGAFVTALFSQGEWFRLITDAGLHASWLHLLLNANLIAIGYGEIESRLGTSRTVVLMVAGAIGASLSTWMFSLHPVVIGASGMAYAALGAIACQLVLQPAAAPLTFRAAPAWWLILLMAVDAIYGLLDETISFSMHAGGFVTGVIVMAALSRTALATTWFVNALAAAAVAVTAGSTLALYQYRAAGNPQHLMQVRLLSAALPAEMNNDAAYRLAMNPSASDSELQAATRSAGRIIAPRVAAAPSREMLARYRDTAAALEFRLGNVDRGRELELLALEYQQSLPRKTDARNAAYAARLALFELAAAAAAPDVTTTIAPAADQLCPDRLPQADRALRAVVLRRDAPIGLLVIGSTAAVRNRCVRAPSVAPTDTVRVTFAGSPTAIGDTHFYPVRAQDADLPAFVLHGAARRPVRATAGM